MKRLYILPSLVIMAAGIFAFQSVNSNGEITTYKKTNHAFGSGGQHSLTGAPGENNCTQCHSGSVLNGDTQNEFNLLDGITPVSSYVPGTSYSATLQLASNPSKRGFSSTVLDNTGDAMAGSLSGSAIGGTQDFQNGTGTRDYVSHTTVSNTSATWAWTWVAPATNVGDVTFYIASNAANDDGATSGDEIYLSEHVIGSTASIDEVSNTFSDFTAGYATEGNKVVLNFTSLIADDMFFNLVDMNGRSVYTNSMSKSIVGSNKHLVALPSEIENGMYVVNFFVGNRAMSAKVLVQQ